jgi:signal transduction histidine kinase
VTDSLLRLLLLLPVVVGLPVLAWQGVLDSAAGLLAGTAALAGLVYLAALRLLRPRRRLARQARRLAPGGPYAGNEWTQISACLHALGRQREQDRARIRELEARLHRAQADAETATTAKRAFLANIGHEIRTPMNVVVGMTRLALRHASNQQQRDHLLRADRAAHGLLTQINNLLDVVKLEAGDLRLQRSAFAVGDLLEQCVAAGAERAERKGLSLRAELEPRVPAVVVGDPDRLQQVLASLMDNALKFTDSGEVVLACRLLDHADGRARLGFEVRDTGVGIGAGQREALFGLFLPGDTSLTRRHGGAGLGLRLCHRLVQAMGGSLRLESGVGLGSSFRFELLAGLPAAPRENDTQAPAGGHAPTDAATGMHPGTTRIRLRGDERMPRRVLRRFRQDHAGFVADYDALHTAGDRFGAAQLARALESAAAALGALELREAAARLALKRRAEDDPGPDLARVEHLLGGLLEAVDARLGAGTGTQPGAVQDAVDAAPGDRDGDGDGDGDGDIVAAPPQLAALAVELRSLCGLLADFDAAAINAFESLTRRLTGLVPEADVEALRSAIHGFDFATAGKLLDAIAANLDIPLKPAH